MQGLQCLLGVVAQTITGGLGTGQGPTECHVLSGEDPRVLIAQTLVLAEEVTDFATLVGSDG